METSTHSNQPLKTIATWAIVVILATLVATAFSGCATTPSKYVGTWEGAYNITDDDGFVFKAKNTLVLNEDGSFTLQQQKLGRWLGTNYGTTKQTGSWSVIGSTMYLETVSVNDSSKKVTYKFDIGSNGNSLTESSNYNDVLHKKSA